MNKLKIQPLWFLLFCFTQMQAQYSKTITINPDKDALLSSSQTTSNLWNDTKFTAYDYTTTNSPIYRTAMEIDLSAIPVGATISSSIFYLYYNSAYTHAYASPAGNNQTYFRRYIAPWREKDCGAGNSNTPYGITWANQPSITGTGQVTLPLITGTGNWTLTNNSALQTMLQGWVSKSFKNYGFLFMLTTEGYYRRVSFCSSDYGTSTSRPKLDISFSYSSPDIKLIPKYDNYIVNLNTAWNSELENYITVQNIPAQGGMLINSLLQFNLAGLPADKVINTAKLKLYCKTATALNGRIKLATSAWDNTVTWGTKPTTTDPNITFSLPANSQYLEVDIAPLVRYWYANPTKNFGISVEADANYALDFYSYDYTTDFNQWPELNINMTTPTYTLNPVTDWTYLNSCYQSGNLGVGWNTGPGSWMYSYIKFDLSSVPQNQLITKADLYLTGYGTATGTNIILKTISNNLTSCSDAIVDPTIIDQQRAWPNVFMDVTNGVIGWNQQTNTNHGFYLYSTESTLSFFYEKDGASNWPKLFLKTETITGLDVTPNPTNGVCFTTGATTTPTFTASPSKTPSSYKWWVKYPGGTDFFDASTMPTKFSGYNSSVLTFTQHEYYGAYQVKCQLGYGGGSIYTNTLTYTIIQMPTPVISANSYVACDNCTYNQVTLDASATTPAGCSFLWSSGQTTSSINVTPTQITGYYVTVTSTYNGVNCPTTSSTVNIGVCDKIYSGLADQAGSGYIPTQKGYLEFTYIEEYNSTSSLGIKIYNESYSYSATLNNIPITPGENKISIDLYRISPALTVGSYYIAEITGSKGIKKYIRFKYQTN